MNWPAKYSKYSPKIWSLLLIALATLDLNLLMVNSDNEFAVDYADPPPTRTKENKQEKLKKEFDKFLKEIWMQKYFHQAAKSSNNPVEFGETLLYQSPNFPIEYPAEWNELFTQLASPSVKSKKNSANKVKRSHHSSSHSQCKTVQTEMIISKQIKSESTGLVERVCQGKVTVNKCEGVCVSSLRPSVNMASGLAKVLHKVLPLLLHWHCPFCANWFAKLHTCVQLILFFLVGMLLLPWKFHGS